MPDPGHLKLWQLSRMARAKQEYDWQRVAFAVSYICRSLGAKVGGPDALNPMKGDKRKGVSRAEWAAFREKAAKILPERLSEEAKEAKLRALLDREERDGIRKRRSDQGG